MKTPFGRECKYFYSDYNRGRNQQECRLLLGKISPWRWQTTDCKLCTVPDILWANASEHLVLQAHIVRGFLGLSRRVEVSAHCRKHDVKILDPYVGCEACAVDRPALSSFLPQDDK